MTVTDDTRTSVQVADEVEGVASLLGDVATIEDCADLLVDVRGLAVAAQVAEKGRTRAVARVEEAVIYLARGGKQLSVERACRLAGGALDAAVVGLRGESS